MFRAVRCSSSGGLILSMQQLISSLSVGDCSVHWLTGAQDSHLQRMTIPEAACMKLRLGRPEDEQGNGRNMYRILINLLYVNK